jgi:hypothetical protein
MKMIYVSVCTPIPCGFGCGYDEYMVVSCLTPGLTYYIMIDGDASYVGCTDFEDVEGDFRISVQEEVVFQLLLMMIYVMLLLLQA